MQRECKQDMVCVDDSKASLTALMKIQMMVVAKEIINITYSHFI